MPWASRSSRGEGSLVGTSLGASSFGAAVPIAGVSMGCGGASTYPQTGADGSSGHSPVIAPLYSAVSPSALSSSFLGQQQQWWPLVLRAMAAAWQCPAAAAWLLISDGAWWGTCGTRHGVWHHSWRTAARARPLHPTGEAGSPVVPNAGSTQVVLSAIVPLVVAVCLAPETADRLRHIAAAGKAPLAHEVQRRRKLLPHCQPNASSGETVSTTGVIQTTLCRGHSRVLSDEVQGKVDRVSKQDTLYLRLLSDDHNAMGYS